MKSQYILTLLRYLLTLVLLLITQIVFWVLNMQSFNVGDISAFLLICWGNIKFALSALSFYLAPFLFLSLIPHNLHSNKVYRIITNIFYFAATEFMLVINLIDCGYYGFTFKRITFDIFNYLGVGGDFNNLIPTFAHDYWHIILIFIILNIVLYKTDSFFRKKYYLRIDSENKTSHTLQQNIIRYTKQTLFFFVIAFVLIIFQRGGLQKRAMGPIHASNYATTQNTALVLNTPYTFYRTIGKAALETKNYFDEQTLQTIFSPIQEPNTEVWTDSLFSEIPAVGKTNVMIIIVESFSAEYTGIYNNQTQSYTPFIDSLAQHSIVFDGMSNGKKSIDGIPAVCSSMPLLNETPYITSSYGNNFLGSVASILKKDNYQAAFFHGGYNGTMNFDGYAHRVGYTDYYGMNEYNNSKDYDGNWGIFDEPFLQYTVKQISTMRQPFVTTLFTLSNHPPYTIPERYKGKFKKGEIPYYETIGYTDFALRKFFESAEKTDWFKNTLFIITGDHSAKNSVKEFSTQLGLYRIPMIIYSPLLRTGKRVNQVLQQTDILPTLMDILHNDKKVFAFGRSAFSKQTHFYIYYSNGEYILMIGDYVSKYRDGFPTQLYNIREDEDLKKDISKEQKAITQRHERLTQAIIQQYNNRLIHNQTTVEDKVITK